MSPKSLIWIGMFVGSFIGSYMPMLWNSNLFSISSILLSVVGGVVGIFGGFYLSKNL